MLKKLGEFLSKPKKIIYLFSLFFKRLTIKIELFVLDSDLKSVRDFFIFRK